MRILAVLRYRLLGPLSVTREGAELDLGRPKQRAVLAVLAQEAGRTVSTDRLLDAVWGEAHPPQVQASLHANVSRLRRLLRDDESSPPPVLRRGGGYLLDAERAQLDVDEFAAQERRAARAVDARDWPTVVEAAGAALNLWRGSYLADLADEEWVRVAAAPLDERRAGAMQHLVTGLLGAGDLSGALARAAEMVVAQPLVERAAWLHMVALHRAGRTGEALAAFRAYSDRLDDELGLEPGPALRDLQGALLRQAPEMLAWPGRPGEVEALTAAISPPSAPELDEPTESTERDAPTGTGGMVGREDELAAVAGALTGLAPHSARWLVVSGPAGIGKSRLAEEAVVRWRREGGRVARAQCPDLSEVPAWWPVRQLLRDLDVDPDPLLAPPSGGDADASRFTVAERVIAAIRAQLDRQPLLLVVDDLHWADPSSLAVLTLLAESVSSPGLAVLLSTRPSRTRPGVTRLLGAVARRPGSRSLTLAPLSRAEVGRLVQQVSGDTLTEVEVSALAERTGGTPFYAVEYARLPRGQRGRDSVPAAVQAVLQQRFDELPPEVHEVLQAAAVLGEPLDAPLLAAVTSRSAADLSELLDEAADRDLLTSSVTSDHYVFGHALLRDGLLAEVAGHRRRRLHARAAEALAGSSGTDPILRRARHLLGAGPTSDARTAYEGFTAAARAADRELLAETAATWWQAAIAALDRLPDGEAGGRADEREAAVGAQVRAMAWAGQGQGVLDVLDAALVEALRAGRTGTVGRLAAHLLRVSGSWPWPVYGSDPAPLMTTLLGLDAALADDPAARARVLAVTAIGCCYDLDAAVPDALSRQALLLAEETGDVDVLADALLGRALTYAGVASHAEESIELLDRLLALEHTNAAADRVLAHNVASMATINLGRTRDCAEHVRAGALGADVLRLPVNRVQLRWAEASLAQWAGDLGRAAELYREAELAHRRTELQQSGTFELAQLVLRWDQGRPAEIEGSIPANPLVSAWTQAAADALAGRAGADEALAAEVHRPEPDVWTSHGRLALLAYAVAERGLAELAPPLLAAMTPVRHCLASFGQVGTLGPVALAMARLADLLGDRTSAEQHLAAAQRLSAESGGAGALVHGRLLAAHWASERGATPALRQELVAIARAADQHGMTGIAQQARALL